MSRENGSSPLAGIAAGALAGLAATWVMTQFQNALTQLQSSKSEHEQQGGQGQQQSEPATAKLARRAAQVVGRDLDERQARTAGQFVHYGFGTKVGAIYGALAEFAPAVTAGSGTLFGTAVWLGADELGVPAARLSPPPTQVPLAVHARALAAHLVYGFTLELGRRMLRRVF